MKLQTALAIYGLSIDAFLQGLATEVEKPESLGITEQQAVSVRRARYKSRIEDIRSKKVA